MISQKTNSKHMVQENNPDQSPPVSSDETATEFSIENNEQLDLFIDNLLTGVASARENPNDKIIKTQLKGDLLSARMVEYLKAKKFYGSVRDYKITILPLDEVIIENLNSARERVKSLNPPDSAGIEPIQPKDALTFLLNGSLYSTGRGRIGDIARKCTVYFLARQEVANVHSLTPPTISLYNFGIQMRNINQDDTLKSIRRLNEVASEYWVLGLRYAMARVVSGGLPGLGKR